MNTSTLKRMEDLKVLELYKNGNSIKSIHKKYEISEKEATARARGDIE